MDRRDSLPLSFTELVAVCPAAVALLGVGCGILAGYGGCGWGVVWMSAAAVALAAGVFSLLSRRGGKWIIRMRNLYLLPVVALFFAIGLGAWLLFSPPKQLPSSGGYAFAHVRDFRSSSSGDVLEVDVVGFKGADYSSTVSLNAPVKALLYTEGSDFHRGDIICFRNFLTPIEAADPVSSGYVWGLYSRGVAWQQTLPVERILLAGHDSSLCDKAVDLRDRAVVYIDHTPLSASTRAFLEALLLGDREQLAPEFSENFSSAGIAHLLALSGMHLGMVVLILSTLLIPFARLLRRRVRILILLLGVWMFVLLTGMSVSVVRAAIMTSVFLVSMLLERRRTAVNTLCIAGVLILLADPVALFNVGFQMSFLTCGALLLLSEYLGVFSMRRFERRYLLLHSGWADSHPRLLKCRILAEDLLLKVGSVALVALAAFAVSWILTAFYFGKLSLMFLPVNLVAGGLVWLIFMVAALYFPLWALGLAPSFLGHILDGLCGLLFKCAELPAASGVGVSHVFVPSEAVGFYIVGLLLFAVWVGTRKGGWLWTSVGAVACALVAVLVVTPELPGEGIVAGRSKGEARIASVTLDGRRELSYPRGELSVLSAPAGDIVVADRNGPEEVEGEKRNCRLLIVGAGCEENVASWVEMFAPEMVAVVSREKCREIAELDSMDVRGQIRLHNLGEVNLYLPYGGEGK